MSWGCPGMLKCSQVLAFLVAFIDTLPWTLAESETHLRNVKVNKASSVNKGTDKTYLIVDMVRKNWS